MDIEALARSRDLSRQVNKELQQIVDEADKTSVVKLEPTYKSVLNQPSLIAVSSTSAIEPTGITTSVAETSFNSFTVNLPRPALNVKSLQLLSMNAPQAQVNIPDNALCFWFYKMATQNFQWKEYDSETTYVPGDNVSIFDEDNSIWNSWRAVETNTASEPALDNDNWVKTSTFKYESPNIFNLFCVRLLPSYYKEELVFNNGGFNRTFTSYEDLQTELQKATSTIDLTLLFGAKNVLTEVTEFAEYTPVANPEEISITFNPIKNKFIFQGMYTNQPNQPPIWNQNTLYPPQSLVRYTPEGGEEAIYVNYSAELTYPPDNASPVTSWVIYYYDNTTIWNTYLLAGYNDPNVIYLQGEAVNLEWNPYHLFQPGSKSITYFDGPFGTRYNNYQYEWTNNFLTINERPPDGYWNAPPIPFGNTVDIFYEVGVTVYTVLAGGTYYRCLIAHYWSNPAAAPDGPNGYWQPVNNPWSPVAYENVSTGMNYISKTYDFRDPFQPTRVLGIPGQPYTKITSQLQQIINNQTLNRILGFTWNGANMPTSFTRLPDLDDNIAFGSLLTLFINRLRPVPTYAYAFPQGDGLLGAYTESPIISLNYYTADSFCNLVYSSTITVYTRILGGSTTDTVRNTNLLAIMPLNCGNLGVTFSANFIDNQLTKVDNDIYSIEFEFRTDNDQPYWFSNNAVITLQLKLTYE
jgi:hypothetical protein